MSAAHPSQLESTRPAFPGTGLAQLAKRLELLGYPVVEVETPEGARALLADRGGSGRAAILPSALADRADGMLEAVVRALRNLAPSRRLVPLAFGAPPDALARQRLRAAGVELALCEPLDAHVLRFQVNRALAAGPLPPRLARRAPVEHEVAVRRRLRTRSIPVYTLSARGAFLLTDRPLDPGRRLLLEVPVGPMRPRAHARVVMANRPDAIADPSLPPGMAVAFEALDGPSAAVINRLVEERLAGLAV